MMDEDLNVIKSRAIPRPPDGVACIDGVLYVGLSVARMYPDKARRFRGNWYGTFDAETLETIREPFMVDHGYDSYAGVQNITTAGTNLYVCCTPMSGGLTRREGVWYTTGREADQYQYL